MLPCCGRRSTWCLLNTRSVVNKAALIHDTLESYDLDFVALTETWLRGDDPPAILQDLAPAGYSVIHFHRGVKGKSRGGGISFIFREGLSVSALDLKFKPKFFELLTVKLCDGNRRVNISILYRPPPAPTSPFFDELNSLCDILDATPGEHILLGDFNCPATFPCIDPRLEVIFSDRNYLQHVKEPTRGDNLLDLIISFGSINPHFILDIKLSLVPFSDHKLITFKLRFPRAILQNVTFSYRNLHHIDSSTFVNLMHQSKISTNPPSCADEYADQLDADVTSALNTVAPLITKTKRPAFRSTAKWITGEAIAA